MQALFGAGSGGGILAITAFKLYPWQFVSLRVEVTLPTLGLLCHHEDDGAQGIGCIVHRLGAGAPCEAAEDCHRYKRYVLYCPMPASTPVGWQRGSQGGR